MSSNVLFFPLQIQSVRVLVRRIQRIRGQPDQTFSTAAAAVDRNRRRHSRVRFPRIPVAVVIVRCRTLDRVRRQTDRSRVLRRLRRRLGGAVVVFSQRPTLIRRGCCRSPYVDRPKSVPNKQRTANTYRKHCSAFTTASRKSDSHEKRKNKINKNAPRFSFAAHAVVFGTRIPR